MTQPNAIPAKFVKVSCPYCEYVNTVGAALSERTPHYVILCGEVTAGYGCSRHFAVQITFTPIIKTYRMEE